MTSNEQPKLAHPERRNDVAVLRIAKLPFNPPAHALSPEVVIRLTAAVDAFNFLPTHTPKCPRFSSRTFASRCPTCCWAKVVASRSRKAASAPDAFTTECG